MNNEISFRDALAIWFRIGLLSFGGPAGQIALMHRIVVEEKKWLDEKRFLHALHYCMLLPGPEAQQLAIYVGWLLHGVRGGLVAGLLFIIPGAIAIFALSILYVTLGGYPLLDGMFLGLKAAVIVIVIQAMIRIGKNTLKTALSMMLAIGGFIALFVFDIGFPFVLLGAAVVGLLSVKFGLSRGEKDASDFTQDVIKRPGTKRAAVVCTALWGVGVIALYLGLGNDHIFSQLATFFSQVTVLTFGGAYAVLSFVAQQGVENFAWLEAGEMMDGLAMAETTPGPLIMVTQFVGFMAAYRNDVLGFPILSAVLGGLVTIWVTFLPCFIWIFVGAPYVEKLRGIKSISAVLSAVSAAVVGVIANLALWFSINALFDEQAQWTGGMTDVMYPVFSSIDYSMLIITCVAACLAFRWKLSILPLLGVCVLAGLLAQLFT